MSDEATAATQDAVSTNAEDLPLQQQMDTLTTLINRLEDPALPLEEAISIYESGMALVKSAQKALDHAEQRVAVINAAGDATPINS